MLDKKIIFMGTPEISANYLMYLIKEKYNIIAAYSQPPRKKGRGMILQKTPVHKYALSKDIDVFTPEDFNNELSQKEISDLKPDLIIVMGYGLKLPNFILELPVFGCINIHVSLLPRWRGAAPIEHALMNGDKKTGISVFKLIEDMDAGPVITREIIDLDNNINKKDLTKKLNLLGPKLLISVLPKIFNNNISYENQDKNKATYAYKISSDLRKLDFNENFEIIHNKVRAFAPNPSAWFYFNNERIKIIKSSFIKGDWQPSFVINDKFHIGCKDGKICPEIIQREGKKPMCLDDFLRGFDFIIGSKVNV